MKKKKTLIIILIILIICLFCSLTFYQYASQGCFWWDCVPKRNFNALDWEIPLLLFPEGAFTDHISLFTDNLLGEIEGGGQTIYMDSGIAIYDIFRFPRIRKAILRFDHDKEDIAEWKIPNNLTFSSATADELHVACGYWSSIYQCEMLARYQEYYLFFNADINDDMTFERFENILFYLDEQISSRLYP